MGWTHISADLLTWAAYTAIPLVLAYYIRRREGPVPGVAWLFVAFILACGLTHLIEAIIFWVPVYRLSALSKVVTAGVSVATVVALARASKQVIDTPEFDGLIARLRNERNQARLDLEQANAALAEANHQLAQVNHQLETKVAERTAELARANAELEAEVEERRTKERELERSQTQLLEAQRLARLGSWRYDAIEDRIEWSNSLYELMGLPLGVPLDGVEAHIRDLYVPEDAARLSAAVERALTEGEPYELEVEVNPGRADAHCLMARGRPVRDENDRVVALEGTVLDISEQRAQTKALAQANQRLESAVEEATAELRKTVSDLEATNADLENFVHMASHDMQAPLRSLRTYSQLLEEDLGDELNESAAADLRFIREASARMRNMIEALVELSMTGRGEVDLRETTVGAVVKGALSDLEERIEDLGAEVTMDALPRLQADPSLLERIYANLLSNALKFGGRPPRIHLTSVEEPTAWVLGVHDHGDGVDPVLSERLFLPFKRSRKHAKVEGMGMGLAIAKRAVERMRGMIWVENDVGAHFRFRIPKRRRSS